ncbi:MULTISPECIES: ATP-binding protein [unclassified Pseudomonas]|uniref:ATP-binding protein n=1 Tax=unclassified Pseudomonas TaxID=196821 RepID=UPI000D3B0C59|nr:MULTISPECIES: ATP-binding protein [unclassified Pseudomonas]RAU40353.1 response regulator [Pseudomonas sp. RIT 409]RAU55490.1 response regulator [Pseudomonas sp. RIT 412]
MTLNQSKHAVSSTSIRLGDAGSTVEDSELRFRALVAASSTTVFRMSPDWQVMRELTGGERLEAVGQPDRSWLDTYLFQDDHSYVLAAIDQAIARRTVFELEHRIRLPNDEVGWALTRAVPIFNQGGEIIEWFGASSDVRARHSAEEQLRRFNSRLEVQVQAGSRDLMAAEAQLRQMQKLEALGQLTGGVAHDFNNLLTIIRNSAELLGRAGLSDDRQKQYLTGILDTADRAARLTGQLLRYARKQALKPEVFSVAQRVEHLVEMLRTVVGEQVTIETIHPPEPCFVEADLNQFETALLNLVINARDAMQEEGTITVTVASQDCGGAGSPAARVLICVADEGRGIEQDDLKRIFEPFFTTKETGKGTGLGLSQVIGFARQSGGEVSVDSRVGEGATFTVSLPSAKAPRSMPLQFARHATPATKRQILVVEDNPEVGEFTVCLLKDLGFGAQLASNAAEALALLDSAAQDIDLVLSDVVMPGMGGLELGELLALRWPGKPLILTSGYSQAVSEDALSKYPMLNKPYSINELLGTINKVLQLSSDN